MQEHPAKAPLPLGGAIERKIAVFSVSNDRMADRVEMAADLVRAAGLDVQLEQRRLGPPRQPPPVGARFLHVDAALLFVGEGLLMFRQTKVDAAGLLLESPFGERQVGLLR